jgi:hypothetical protein
MSNDIQKKLSQFEAQPPQKVWDKIAIALDQNEFGMLGERLSQFESMPTSIIWNKINEDLDKKTQAKIIPFYKKHATTLRYGSAIAIFVVIATVVSLFISKKTISEVPSQNIANSKQPVIKKDQQKISEDDLQDENEKITLQALNKPEKQFHTQRRDNTFTTSSSALGFILSIDKLIPKFAKRTTAIAFNSPVDKYMVYSNENGSAVKLPKKLFDAIACPAQDVICQKKFKQMQEKFAASALTTGFTGVLDILNKLGENQ